MCRDRLAAAVIAIAAAVLPAAGNEARGAGDGAIDERAAAVLPAAGNEARGAGDGAIDEHAAARAAADPAAVTSPVRAAGSAGSRACETDSCQAARSAGQREKLRDASAPGQTGTSSADSRGTTPDRRSRRAQAARAGLLDQLDDQARSVDRALATVQERRRAQAARAELLDQLDDQARSVDRALATVQERLAGLAAARAHRLAAALRVGRAIPDGGARIVARRLAAAELLLARDRDEHALLLDEIAGLTAARDRIAAERTRAAVIALPDRLGWPAAGAIARHFGALVHERSRATLSRRGIDLEVAERSAVVAPAAGTVRYAGPIRGLDRGVIVDHGDYVTVIAKLGDLALPVDATVAIGDRLGRAAHHRVYLEVRVKLGPGGLPIDPEPLLGPRAEDRTRPARRSPRAGLD